MLQPRPRFSAHRTLGATYSTEPSLSLSLLLSLSFVDLLIPEFQISGLKWNWKFLLVESS